MQRRYKIGAELPEYDAPCALADGWAALPDADIPATDGDTVVVVDCTMQGALARKGGSCAAAARAGTNLCPTDFSAWESGDYAWQTGEKVEDAKKIRLIELIPVQGGCTYVCDTHGPQNINNTKDSVVFTIRTYDADKVYLETITTAPHLPQCTVAASANTVYFGVAMAAIHSNGGQTVEYPYSWWQEQFAAGAIHPEIRLQTAEETAALDKIETHTFNQAAEAQKQITGE